MVRINGQATRSPQPSHMAESSSYWPYTTTMKGCG
jgi:hypothetical protein